MTYCVTGVVMNLETFGTKSVATEIVCETQTDAIGQYIDSAEEAGYDVIGITSITDVRRVA